MKWILKHLHLIVSSAIVVPTALIYGLYPSYILPQFLDVPEMTVDLSNFLRAIMCLYLGVAIIWILGIVKPKYWRIATQLNVLFMLTLASGRIMSMVLDGSPSGEYVFGVIAEVALGLFSLYQLKRFATIDNN